jgi:hypothetical protein
MVPTTMKKAAVPEHNPLAFPFKHTTVESKRPTPYHSNTQLFDDPQRTLRTLPDEHGLNSSVQLGHTYRDVQGHASRPPIPDPDALHDVADRPGLPKRVSGVKKGAGHVGHVVRKRHHSGTVGPADYAAVSPLVGTPATATLDRGGVVHARANYFLRKNASLFVNTADDWRRADPGSRFVYT